MKPVDLASARSGAELMVSPAHEGVIGDGDAVLAGIAIGASEGVELLKVVGLQAGLVEQLPAGGFGERRTFVDPAAGKGPAAAVGGAVAADEEDGQVWMRSSGGAQSEDYDASTDLGPGDATAVDRGLWGNLFGNSVWHHLQQFTGLQYVAWSRRAGRASTDES